MVETPTRNNLHREHTVEFQCYIVIEIQKPWYVCFEYLTLPIQQIFVMAKTYKFVLIISWSVFKLVVDCTRCKLLKTIYLWAHSIGRYGILGCGWAPALTLPWRDTPRIASPPQAAWLPLYHNRSWNSHPPYHSLLVGVWGRCFERLPLYPDWSWNSSPHYTPCS